MPDKLSKLISQPSCKNFYPNCVSLKLHVEIEKASTAKVLRSENFLISLSIVFGGEQEISFPGVFEIGFLKGKVTFGLKKGLLNLSLDGCQLPLEKVRLEKPLKISSEREIEQEMSSEAEIGASIVPESNSNGNGKVGIKGSRKRVEKFKIEDFQVRKIGSEEMPAWVFEASPSESTLQGSLKSVALGELLILSKPSRIEAVFSSRAEDIRITWGEMGTTKNISRNKMAVIERAIVKQYLSQEVNFERMSEVAWNYG